MEKIEIEAKVKDPEILLILTGAKEIGAETGASTNHLPELDFGVNRLKENEVYDFRHINASVHHVHGNSDVGGFVGDGEIIDQALVIFFLVVNDPSEVASIVGIVVIESRFYEFGMVVVPGKDNCFPEAIATFNFVPLFHQVLEDKIDGIRIE